MGPFVGLGTMSELHGRLDVVEAESLVPRAGGGEHRGATRGPIGRSMARAIQRPACRSRRVVRMRAGLVALVAIQSRCTDPQKLDVIAFSVKPFFTSLRTDTPPNWEAARNCTRRLVRACRG